MCDDSGDMFKQMRRSDDRTTRQVGEAELGIWLGMKDSYGPIVDWMIANAPNEEMRTQAFKLKRELEDRAKY